MRVFSVIAVFLPCFYCTAQVVTPPRLVVGIVVDQMRNDFLYRYWDKYSEGGFKKLLNNGYYCKNTHYNYVPTYTGPGHASIYTGTTPARHGIIANEWFDRKKSTGTYCVTDSTVNTVGAASVSGKRSPAQMLATTITDELRMVNNFRSKVISISLKDRGAILPGGHSANAAYWFDDSGSWVTSTWYMATLPAWVKIFNEKKLAQKYLSESWTTLLPVEQYTESAADDNPYEGLLAGETRPVFPHELSLISKRTGMGLIRKTPFGNSLTKDFAIEAIKNETLGKDKFTDFLAVSFSSTDYIGHHWGPQSIEVEDAYLRLDKDIAEFIAFLEEYVGKENLLIFMTSDHGVADVPAYLQANKMPGFYVDTTAMLNQVKEKLNNLYGKEEWILDYSNSQIYLDHDLIKRKKVDLKSIQKDAADAALSVKSVVNTYTAEEISSCSMYNTIGEFIQNGFLKKRSGDIVIVFQPGAIETSATGTTHSTHYSYDTHVPLIWYGWRIKPGSTVKRIAVTDIAPTLSVLLNIPFPNGCTGNPVELSFK